MTTKLDTRKLKNGLTILGEPMPQVGSVAFGLMIPCGTARIEKGCCGAGNIITDWVMRGAGNRDSRKLVDELDGLGLHRGSSVGTYRMTFSGSMEASNLLKALEIYADVILRPQLAPEQFELSKQLALHGLASLDDDPRRKVMIRLREHFYADPLGRPSIGYKDDIESLTSDKAAAIIKENFNLSKTIFTVAGKYDFDAVCNTLEKLFDIDQPEFDDEIKKGNRDLGYTHIQHDGAQVHIGMMVETVPAKHEDYYNILAAVSVLSGGMSSRLFTEVREKRGLCYAIGANYNSLRDRAGITCYAGTTPDKAQQTLDVAYGEFKKLSDGITEEELNRAKVGLKSSLIMRSESSMNRAASIGGDYNLIGRVRSLEEVKRNIDAITVDSVIESLQRHPFEEKCIVSIGPKEIDTSAVIA